MFAYLVCFPLKVQYVCEKTLENVSRRLLGKCLVLKYDKFFKLHLIIDTRNISLL